MDAVELDEVAYEVTVDDGSRNAAVEVFLQHFLSFFGMAHVAHVFLVHGVEVAALDPAIVDTGFFQFVDDGFVGVDNDAVGIRDVVANKDACHTLARTVLNAVSGVDDDSSFIFHFLEQVDGFLFAAHVQNDAF